MVEEIATQLVATIDPWRTVLQQLDKAAVRYKPSADRWSICEVVGHLIDSACNNHQRFVRAQSTKELTFPKYDQNEWVRASNYHQSDWQLLVELWYFYNQQLAQIIRHIPAECLTTPCTIPPNETCTLQFLIEDYLVHLQHHLRKIKERIDKSTQD